jgi:hypothetical protein
MNKKTRSPEAAALPWHLYLGGNFTLIIGKDDKAKIDRDSSDGPLRRCKIGTEQNTTRSIRA